MQHEMAVMSRRGDDKIRWMPDVPEEVAAARERFDALKAQGFSIFAAAPGGAAATRRLESFDPNEASLVAVPILTGG